MFDVFSGPNHPVTVGVGIAVRAAEPCSCQGDCLRLIAVVSNYPLVDLSGLRVAELRVASRHPYECAGCYGPVRLLEFGDDFVILFNRRLQVAIHHLGVLGGFEQSLCFVLGLRAGHQNRS